MTDEYKGGVENAETGLYNDGADSDIDDVENEDSEYGDSEYGDSEYGDSEYGGYSDYSEQGDENYNETERYYNETTADHTDEYETGIGTSDDVINGLDTVLKSFDSGTPDISNMILGAVTVASGASAMVVNMRKKLKNKALDYINMAEEEFIGQSKSGKSKKIYAVQAMTKSVPALLRPFVSTGFAEKAIDSSFSNMNKFAKLQSAKENPQYEPDNAGEYNEPEMPEHNDLNNERFAPIADLIKNRGKSFVINNRSEPQTTENHRMENMENKSSVVVNLFLEQPDGAYMKESHRQENNEAVNINIGYKCRFAGEDNSICRECAFNVSRSVPVPERKETYEQ